MSFDMYKNIKKKIEVGIEINITHKKKILFQSKDIFYLCSLFII